MWLWKFCFCMSTIRDFLVCAVPSSEQGTSQVGAYYVKVICCYCPVRPVRGWELSCQKYSSTDQCQGRVEMYAASSIASYKSPSSSSLTLIPLWRKASFSGCMVAESWSCLKPIISVSGDERAVEASLL